MGLTLPLSRPPFVCIADHAWVALQTLVGYLREVGIAHVDDMYPYFRGRYHCWFNLALSHWLIPKANLAGHVSGIGAGLLTIYLPQACECHNADAICLRGWSLVTSAALG